MTTREFNFDGLIGPTHNYAGLSFGNVASTAHRDLPSSPRAAAIQGLKKMKVVSELGIGQCVLPPLRRPRLEFLRELGFSGTETQIVDKAYRSHPELLAVCFSASNMWTANAATVSPSMDCTDSRVHLTPANLSSTLHRSIEHPSTLVNLSAIFVDQEQFTIHEPLPSQPALADEGAANHTRLCATHADRGLEFFVYGADTMNHGAPAPKKFPARQTRLASQAIARRHGVSETRALFAQQNPAAIDAGVFHNDVISVGNQNVLLCHELAFVHQSQQIELIRKVFEEEFGSALFIIEFSETESVSKILFQVTCSTVNY